MRFLSLISILFTLQIGSSAYAQNCFDEVLLAFEKAESSHSVTSIAKDGQLLPGEEKPYLQSEIWNESDLTLDVYLVESAFMGSYVNVVLVEPTACIVKNIIEVYSGN